LVVGFHLPHGPLRKSCQAPEMTWKIGKYGAE
jgi:hypothetical protein